MKFAAQTKTYFDPAERLQQSGLEADSFQEEQFLATLFDAMLGGGKISVRTDSKHLMFKIPRPRNTKKSKRAEGDEGGGSE